MQVQIKIQGLREVARAMRELPNRVDRKILNAGLLEGARVIRDEARQLAPVLKTREDKRWRPGALRRAIQTVAINASRAQYAGEVIVRVRKLSKRQVAAFKRRQSKRKKKVDSRLNPADAFYWSFVEFGTAKIPARPFMRPAFESKKQQAIDAAIRVFRERIQLEIAKLGRTTA